MENNKIGYFYDGQIGDILVMLTAQIEKNSDDHVLCSQLMVTKAEFLKFVQAKIEKMPSPALPPVIKMAGWSKFER